MLSIGAYAFGAFVSGIILSMLIQLLRPMKNRLESNSPLVCLFCLLFTFTAPFAYVEILTKMKGNEIKDAVALGYQDMPIEGGLHYFRILSWSGDRAKVLVVGEEKESWGGLDRPMATLILSRERQGWKTDNFNMLHSERLDKDSIMFPPYR